MRDLGLVISDTREVGEMFVWINVTQILAKELRSVLLMCIGSCCLFLTKVPPDRQTTLSISVWSYLPHRT